MPVWAENMLWISEAVTFPLVTLILIPVFFGLFFKEIKKFLSSSRFAPPWSREGNPPRQDGVLVLPDPDGAEQRPEREDTERRDQALQQALEASQWETYFEQTYGLIFASQMRVLNDLNPPGMVLTQNVLRTYVPTTLTQFGTTFEQWIQYLVARGLVEVHEQNVLISEAGRRFLRYVADKNYSQWGRFPQF